MFEDTTCTRLKTKYDTRRLFHIALDRERLGIANKPEVWPIGRMLHPFYGRWSPSPHFEQPDIPLKACDGIKKSWAALPDVTGLRTKRDEFFSNNCESEYDIICTTETWLNNSIRSQSYFSSEYSVIMADRSYTEKTRNGGGVLIACKSTFQAFRRKDIESYEESIWIELAGLASLNYLIGCYYFPRNYYASAFVDHFAALESTVVFSRYNMHIYGDFNIPKVNWSRCPSQIQSDFTHSKRLHA